MTTSARSIACKALTMLNFSMASCTLARRRMPAVSMSSYLRSLRTKGTDTLSRVVPG